MTAAAAAAAAFAAFVDPRGLPGPACGRVGVVVNTGFGLFIVGQVTVPWLGSLSCCGELRTSAG